MLCNDWVSAGHKGMYAETGEKGISARLKPAETLIGKCNQLKASVVS